MKVRKKYKLVFLLNVAQRAVERWKETKGDGPPALSAAQAGTMYFLSTNDGALIGDVAQALRIGAPAMSGLAARLEAAGYLIRTRDSEDGRAFRLYQTDEGRLAGRRSKASLGVLNERLSEGFSDDEMEVVGRWLESLVDKFSAKNAEKHEK